MVRFWKEWWYVGHETVQCWRSSSLGRNIRMLRRSSLFMKPQDLINLSSTHNAHSFLQIWILLLHRRTQRFPILYISELNITGAQGPSMRRPLLEILNWPLPKEKGDSIKKRCTKRVWSNSNLFADYKRKNFLHQFFLCASESWFVLWIILQKPMQ